MFLKLPNNPKKQITVRTSVISKSKNVFQKKFMLKVEIYKA